MSIEHNKAIVRRCWEEMLNTGNLRIAEAYIAPDYIDHQPDQEIKGIEGVKHFVTGIRAALPDIHFRVEEQLAEGEQVATRWTTFGMHQGELMGIPPTGKAVTVTGMVISRLAGGKIVEEWDNMDQLGLLRQLGVVPPLGQG
ncbi:ester cyclase [Candidatus Poribacteria bacterium]|nr:ester cyclase [Candidatus Poribacteria bacterium]